MTVKKRKRRLSPEERKKLYKVTSNAGVGWDYPGYRQGWADPRYEPTDPRRYEEGKDEPGDHQG